MFGHDVADILRHWGSQTTIAAAADLRSGAICKLCDGVNDLLLLFLLLRSLFRNGLWRQLNVRRWRLGRLSQRGRYSKVSHCELDHSPQTTYMRAKESSEVLAHAR